MVIDERYVGFVGQIQGGYLCGIAARELGPKAEIRLRQPVAAGSDIAIEQIDGGVRLTKGDTLVAEGSAVDFTLDTPPAMDVEQSRRCAQTFPGFHTHPFPGCFCCGPARSAGDGLRIFPGWIYERQLAAAVWEPHRAFADSDGTVPGQFVWAALDCPALWALMFAAPDDSDVSVVTGTIAMQVLSPIEAERPYVILAWPMGEEGRKIFTAAALYDEHGRPVAIAKQTCVRVEKGLPLGCTAWSRRRQVG
jgi:hypothetical protein